MKAAAKTKQDENSEDNIDESNLPTLETLLVGDDLGFIHKYDFKDPSWHYCFYKDFTKLEVREDMENEDQSEAHQKADEQEDETPANSKSRNAKSRQNEHFQTEKTQR
jgi:hypothetical protein